MSGESQVVSSGALGPLLYAQSSVGQEKALMDSDELAAVLNVPVSWVREQTRSRAVDPIPHLRLGKYVRFIWSSAELQDWIARKLVTGIGETNRYSGKDVIQ
jgi:hypothetical protein